MGMKFLDALVEWTKDNSEIFRKNGIVPTLSARNTTQLKNSQGLNLSHAQWQMSLIVWDSGESKMEMLVNKTGATFTKAKRYPSPKYLRENLSEWLLRKTGD